MRVDFFGNGVRAETDGHLVSLNDLTNSGNCWRLQNGLPSYQLSSFISSKSFKEYLDAASIVWGIPKEGLLIRRGKGNASRTMGHVSIAMLLAEQISPIFHATVHKVFIEGKLLEFRSLGSTEFATLNSAIDTCLPDRVGKDNKFLFINIAKMIRLRVLGNEDKTWDEANVDQIHLRFDIEKQLSKMLRLGVVKDWDHLKELVNKI